MFNQIMKSRDSKRFFQFIFCTLILFVTVAVLPVKTVAGLFGGEVVKVKSEEGVIVIQTKSKKKRFKISPNTKVLVDGKETELSAIKAGMRVSISTKGKGNVTKVSGKNSVKADATPGKKSRTPAKKKPKKKNSNRKTVSRTVDTGQGWTGFRGALRDNISHETGLLKEWPEEGPKLLWQAKGMGEGYASVSIAGGKVYTMGSLDGKEQVLALNVADGETLWTIPTGGKPYKESRGNGPRCTPTIDGNQVYAVGANGDLICIDVLSAKKVWSKNILKEFDAENIKWGISESVLIDGEKLICTPGGKKATIAALDKKTGKVIWTGKAPDTPTAAYASPIRIEVDGIEQYVCFTSSGVVAVSVEDGKFLWQDGSSANKVANCSTPLYEEGKLFYASGYGTGASLLDLTSSGKKVNAKVRYQTKDMKNHHGGMVLLDGHVYGSNDPGVLTCMDFETGDVVWKKRSVGKGSIAYADGMIYLRSEKGPVALVEATPDGYKENGKFEQPDRSENKSWPHPVIYNGKLYLRDMDTLLCYDIKAK